MHKKILLLLAALIGCLSNTQAQKPVAYLFDTFETGTIWLNNFTKVTVPLNYDAANHLLLYQQEETLMELNGNTGVDSITVGNRLLIPFRQRFVEYVPLTDGHFLLIDWTLTDKYSALREGSNLNPRTIADVQAVNVGALYARQPDTETDNHIYQRENRNEYTIVYNDKRVTFRNKKSFLKALPMHDKEMKVYIRDHLLDFSLPGDVVKAVEHLYSL